MFNNFFQNGSLLSVILMTYAFNVMIEALRREKLNPLMTPTIIKNPISSILMFLAIPCAIWPAIYIGKFDGLIAGIVAWLVLQLIGATATFLLGIRGPLLGVHFIIACLVFPIGYYLSYSTLS